MLQVMPHKPLGFRLGSKNETKAERVEESPKKRMEEMASKRNVKRKGRDEARKSINYEKDQGKVRRSS